MGTNVSLSLVVRDETRAATIADAAFLTIRTYEQTFSRFLPSSELSLLNAKKELVVSESFFEVLAISFALYIVTAGAFNPLVQIKRLGYRSVFAALPDIVPEALETPYNTNFDLVSRDYKTRRVTLRDDQELDFGGILKGYLATKLARELVVTYPDIQGLILNLGGDLHTIGRDAYGEPFVFYLYNPVTEQETTLPLTNMSLTTSGTYQRRWQTPNGPVHHVVGSDGRHNPSTDIVSASIAHPDGAVAEAYATLFLVTDFKNAAALVDTTTFNYHLITQNGATRTNIL